MLKFRCNDHDKLQSQGFGRTVSEVQPPIFSKYLAPFIRLLNRDRLLFQGILKNSVII